MARRPLASSQGLRSQFPFSVKVPDGTECEGPAGPAKQPFGVNMMPNAHAHVFSSLFCFVLLIFVRERGITQSYSQPRFQPRMPPLRWQLGGAHLGL